MLSAPASAASFDPDLKWRTIRTDHFKITFHQGEEQLAEEFSALVEDVYDEMTDEMAWTPRGRTELVIVDRTDSANGYASVVPYNQIVIFVTAPTESSSLGYYEDWSDTVFTHELTHILHIDTNFGMVRAARWVVGKVASTNRLSPSWMTEGLATLQETRHTTGGRGRAPTADMILRTAAVEDAWPPLGNLDGFQAAPPSGNLRYLFGQDFMEFVADERGHDVWTRWTTGYGSWIPYWLPSKRVFGKQLVPMYFDWKADRFDQYGEVVARVDAEGRREGRLVSNDYASCGAPAFSPDADKLVWSCSDQKMGSQIWMSDGQGYSPEILLQDRGAGQFTWRADSKAFAYSGSHIVNRFNVWNDIYLHELDGKTSALTQGARARDPEFTPDGSHLYMVTNRVQNNQLEVMTVDKRRTALTQNTDHTQYSTPRFHPGGQVMALSVWQHGRRDLWLYDRDGEPLRRLTADMAIDRDPVWSTDGRWLYFSSDRTGIPNVYGIEIETEKLYQFSNVRTGALRPSVSPDNTMIAYQQYSADGYDVRILDIDTYQPVDRGFIRRDLFQDQPLSELVPPVQSADTGTVTTAWSGEPLPPSRPAPDPATIPTPAGFPQHDLPGLPPLGVLRQDSDSIQSFDQSDVEGVFGEEQDYPFSIKPRRYNPLPGLLPRYWLPWVQSTPAAFGRRRFTYLPGFQANAATAARDPLSFWAWSAGINYRSDADFLGGFANITYNRHLPVYSLSARSIGVPFVVSADAPRTPDLGQQIGGQVRDDDGDLVPTDAARRLYWERRRILSASVAYPYTARTTVFASYSFTERTAMRPLTDDIWADTVPTRGSIGQISAGWRYAWSQQNSRAISREDGRIFSLVGAVLHPAIGTRIKTPDGGTEGLRQVQLTSEIREYMVNPWVPNHVLAVRAAGGLTLGETAQLGNYRLGGSFGDSAFYATPEGSRMVRGYDFGADIGDMYWIGGAEYRFPVWRIDRGVGTVPFFARYASASLFVDAGNAFTTLSDVPDAFDDALVGTGAELTLATAIGYRTGFNGTVGWAIGLTPGGNQLREDFTDTFYARLGGSF